MASARRFTAGLKSCATVALISTAGALAAAQAVTDKLEGTVCQLPDCDIRRSLPTTSWGFPNAEAEEHYIHLVRNTLASLLDPSLPAVRFDEWLTTALPWHVALRPETTPVDGIRELRFETDKPANTEWTGRGCDDPRSAIPRPGPDLCVEASRRWSAEHSVVVAIAVAEGASAADGTTGWRPHEPIVRDIYIRRHSETDSLIDSRNVQTLGELQNMGVLLAGDWPSVDLRSDLTWSPTRWKPGGIVALKISVENVGNRDADRAWLKLSIGVPRTDTGDAVEISREWFPRVPAQGRVQFDMSVRLPRGRALASVMVDALNNGQKPFTESNPADNQTIKWIFSAEQCAQFRACTNAAVRE